jgi:hypothetical protein
MSTGQSSVSQGVLPALLKQKVGLGRKSICQHHFLSAMTL